MYLAGEDGRLYSNNNDVIEYIEWARSVHDLSDIAVANVNLTPPWGWMCVFQLRFFINIKIISQNVLF